MKTVSAPYEGYPEVEFWWRLTVCFVVIGLGMIFTAPHPGALLWIPLYPSGFAKSLGLDAKPWGGHLSYLVFTVSVIGVLAADRKRIFRIFALLLCVVCAITTKGCHDVLNGLSGIN
jgi:hypothetical protein